MEEALKTPWGQLFTRYGDGNVIMPGMEPRTVVQAAAGLTLLAVLLGGIAWLFGRNSKES